MLAEWDQGGIAVKYEAEALFGQGCKYSSCAQFLVSRSRTLFVKWEISFIVERIFLFSFKFEWLSGAGSSATNPIGGEETSLVRAHVTTI